MTATRILAWTVVLAMSAAIAFGFANGGIGDDGSAIWALPWGKVSLIDLYLGLALFGGWIGYRERSTSRRLMWWAALVVLGNLAAGAYLVQASLRSDDMTQLVTGERINRR